MRFSVNEVTAFNICVADVIFSVRCCFTSTKLLCSSYLVEDSAQAQEAIVITKTDLDRERAWVLRKDPQDRSTVQAIESLALCRQLALRLPNYDSILFHCSALAFDGEGVLFTAKSGTGKSTHTRLWREMYGDRVVMINDDKPFLRITENGAAVYGSPWRGKHNLGTNTSAPVRAICVVCRGEDNRLERVSAREMFPLLLQQTYAPEDPVAMACTLALVDKLSKQVGLFRLYCNMDPEAAEVACGGIFTDKKDGAL